MAHKGNIREAVQAKLNHMSGCMENKDIHGLAERYFDGAKLFPSHEHTVSGRDHIESWYKNRLQHEGKDFHLIHEVKEVDDFDKIVVAAGSFYALHENEETGHGKFLVVLERHDEDEHHKYKIHYHMWNSDQPPHYHKKEEHEEEEECHHHHH